MKTATNSISLCGALKEQKTHSQKKSNTKDKKIQSQTEWEIKNLKAAQATGVSSQQLVYVISKAMSWLYVGAKKTPTENTNNGGKKFMGTPRPPKPSMGVDGSLDINLTYQYCKDTRHELENCKQPQNKLAHEHAAMWSIVTEESLNTKHH